MKNRYEMTEEEIREDQKKTLAKMDLSYIIIIYECLQRYEDLSTDDDYE